MNLCIILWFISFFCTLSYFSVVLFLFIGWKKLKPCNANHDGTVSIIVACRNEEKNITSCIEALLGQAYPRSLLEIIIVDDRSTDNTAKFLKEYTEKYTFIKLVTIQNPPEYPSSKKWALTQGILSASHDIMLFTDADCIPSPTWASTVVSCFSAETGFVAGFSPIHCVSRPLWNCILGLDSMAAAFVSAGSIGQGKATTCTGRNLAYRRELFMQVGGFRAIAHSLSGDDDLFLQLVQKDSTWQISYATNPASVVPSPGPVSMQQFVLQKTRHLSAGRYYGPGQKMGYAIWHLSNLMIWALALFALIKSKMFLILLALKMIVDFMVLMSFARKYKYSHILWGFPIWEIFFLLYHFIIGPVSFFTKIKWKNS